MGWFTSNIMPLPVFDHEALKKEIFDFDFPREIPAVGQSVKIVYFTDDNGSVAKLETTVVSRESLPEAVRINVLSLTHRGKIGTQWFKLFKWDRASKKWSFWDMYDEKDRPAILTF
ncbi:MAG: hypothetical protein HYT64_01005 [Candidatus Yanofskybacteria bacterium]|nr:hypothetical protein [Candidatus Yanofskybacteria bacterium]